ncbi:hypothetical protein J9253_01510 [Thiothrix litoralis]|uniref:Uncharacterized protein n=1 Tax=Thiothrix litoralis TaxID=2891210 RepID=A0ABX7WVY3_9GAMM|nr:hypothetical protein [Thiothrix litoralis]QTR46663.1 hypothetical protein J9253_01510 [Thiothrix litoralis]
MVILAIEFQQFRFKVGTHAGKNTTLACGDAALGRSVKQEPAEVSQLSS